MGGKLASNARSVSRLSVRRRIRAQTLGREAESWNPFRAYPTGADRAGAARRPDGKAGGRGVLKHADDEQRSQPGCIAESGDAEP
jgi:hypothetical protein